MGSVWLAHDTSLDTPCAIKFVHDEAAQSAEARERFKLEARAAAQLRSPNVVQILDYGVSGGMPYIAMEYLEGEDLGQRISRLGRLGPAETVAIASQVAKALTRANAAGLVHRDLKPANIFLVRDEDRDLAKVLDFGVAKQNLPGVDAHTRTGALVGTPYYMSPEQARGDPVGVVVDGTDVYWVARDDGTVMKCANGGCNNQPTKLATGQNKPDYLVVDGTSVYWTDSGSVTDGSVMKIAK